MASGVDVKMGVSGVAQFKSAMQQSGQSVKTLDAALKLNEKQLQATGDKETYMAQKSKLLQQQIAAQSNVVKQGQQALQAMDKNGVDPASKAYQKLQEQVLNAQAALIGMQSDMDGIGQSANDTAQQTDHLAESLSSINKKVNFDAVLNGIGKITDGMEAAAQKVAALARDVWDTMAAAASWADNENTLAAMYGIDVETLQQMQGAARSIDTSVEAIIRSQQKLKQNMVYGSDDVMAAFKELGVSIGYVTGKGNEVQVFRDATDVFWEAGEALKNYTDEVQRDAMAQKIFGRSWQELMPLFNAGRDGYERVMSEQSIVTEDNVNKLQELDDALQKLDQDYQAMKNTILAKLAPAFTEVAGALSDMIQQVNEYLKTDEGKEKMEALGEAVKNLFSGIKDVDFSRALGTAKSMLDGVTGALGWIADNQESVITAIKGIGEAFLALKAAQIVGTLVQTAAGLKSLIGGGGAAANAAGGAAAGGAAVSTIGLTSAYLKGLLSSAKATATAAAPFLLQESAMLAAALAPAVIAQTQDYARAEAQREERLQTAESSQGTAAQDAAFLIAAANALGIQRDANGNINRGALGVGAQWGDPAAIEAILSGLEARQNQQLAELYNTIMQYGPTTSDGNYTWNQLLRYWEGEPMDLAAETALLDAIVDAYAKKLEAGNKTPEIAVSPTMDENAEGILQDEADDQDLKVTTTPELPPDAASILQNQLNVMDLHAPVRVDLTTLIPDGSHANGLPFVPFDGYIAALHKGERVVPANQNKNYSATSNLYVESMYMNNGTDAQGLAAAMAAENRRVRAGFGS